MALLSVCRCRLQSQASAGVPTQVVVYCSKRPSPSTVRGVISQMYPNIRAIRLRIHTRWSRPTSIPGPVLGNILRGAVGLTLRKLVCPEEWLGHDCPPCSLYQQCAYGQVFAPTPPADAQQLRLQQDLPRPFVIEPPGLAPEDRVTPDGLTFRLMLFGSAIERLPYLISTLDRLGADGMGRDRTPFSIETISTCHPTESEMLYGSGGTAVLLPKRFITTEDLLSIPWPTEQNIPLSGLEVRRRVLARMGIEPTIRSQAEVASRPQLKVRFLTPLLLKSGSGIDEHGHRIAAQEIREAPPFGVIIRRLRDRLSSLCLFFGERWDCPNFAGLGTLADQVTIASSQTTWLTRNRHSSKTGQSHEISGLVGQTIYTFPDQSTFETLSPLLRIGELIHAGKWGPWGNGRISCSCMK